jgi:hypothetical protein
MSTTAALEIISSTSLSPTEHLLLKRFISEAVDSEVAANYLLSRIAQDGLPDTEISLRDFKKDWRKLTKRSKNLALLETLHFRAKLP